jgi:hypothetical protein
MVTELATEGSEFVSRYRQDLSPLHILHTGSGARLTSYTVGTEGYFPERFFSLPFTPVWVDLVTSQLDSYMTLIITTNFPGSETRPAPRADSFIAICEPTV